MTNKICPLLSIAGQAHCPCNADGCAWYDEVTSGCALEVIAEHLDRIALMQEEANGL